MSDPVRVERHGPVTTVILNRPEARNAVNGPTAAALFARSRNSTVTTPHRWRCCGVITEHSAPEQI